MAEHTKGEWVAHVFETHYVLTAVRGTWSVLLAVVNRDPVVLPETWEMHKANAHLIAAAPKILEALELAVIAMKHHHGHESTDIYGSLIDFAEEITNAEAAIAQAHGTA